MFNNICIFSVRGSNVLAIFKIIAVLRCGRRIERDWLCSSNDKDAIMVVKSCYENVTKLMTLMG